MVVTLDAHDNKSNWCFTAGYRNLVLCYTATTNLEHKQMKQKHIYTDTQDIIHL